MKISNNNFYDTIEVPIRFSEVDSLGIIWHGHYAQYFELGRESLGEKNGLTYSYIRENGYFAPLTKLDMNYVGYAIYGDTLIIKTYFTPVKIPQLIFSYEIFSKNTKKKLCTGSSKQVFVDKNTFKLQLQKPDFIINWEKRFN